METKKPINTSRENDSRDDRKFPRVTLEQEESLEKEEALKKKDYSDRSHGRTHDSAIDVDNPGTV
ncbi:hypothetical protein [Parapedobacter lycopersici]|uniref:hypothetical protein n=1 Tax=Parapedobacter lycopersici TaxID=1864939 RepID=UPI0033427AFC